MMSKLGSHVHGLALSSLTKSNGSSNGVLEGVLRLLAKWRSLLLQNTLIQQNGTTVHQGLLAGLKFLDQSSEGCHVAKLLGTYEQPLQGHVRELLDRGNYKTLINIGCAEGYYAVGLARTYPALISYAYDTDPRAREACKGLAAKNGVEDRVIIDALFAHKEFSKFSDINTLIFCDIEGAEKELLDPVIAPELSRLDIIVESHECLVPGVTELLIERFSATHDITRIDDDGMRLLDAMPPWFYKLAHLDQLLCIWEWRSGPTPWLVMIQKGKLVK
jgi:hypothetical protein